VTGLLGTSHYKKNVLPVLHRLFMVKELVVRRLLLTYFEFYCHLFDKELLRTLIMPTVSVNGMYNNILHYSLLLCSAAFYSVPICSILFYSALLRSTLLYSVPLCATPLYSAPLCATLRHSAPLCATLCYSALCYHIVGTLFSLTQ